LEEIVFPCVVGLIGALFIETASLGATSYPFVAVLHMAGETDRGQEVRVLGSFVGPLGVDEFLGQLMGVLEEHDAVLAADRLEKAERERSRTLLQQQDREYEEGLLADRSRQQKQMREESKSSVPVATAVAAAPVAVARAPVPRYDIALCVGDKMCWRVGIVCCITVLLCVLCVLSLFANVCADCAIRHILLLVLCFFADTSSLKSLQLGRRE
jgi:hypothetical protein